MSQEGERLRKRFNDLAQQAQTIFATLASNQGMHGISLITPGLYFRRSSNQPPSAFGASCVRR